MKRLACLLAIAAAAALTVHPVLAQSEGRLRETIETLNRRMPYAAAAANDYSLAWNCAGKQVLMPAPPSPACRPWLDVIAALGNAYISGNTLHVDGWAARCGAWPAKGTYEVDLRLNGLAKTLPNQGGRQWRLDAYVHLSAAGWCAAENLLPQLGIWSDIDVSDLAPGRWIVALEIWNDLGQGYRSNNIEVTK
jgi:hypothetical protein